MTFAPSWVRDFESGDFSRITVQGCIGRESIVTNPVRKVTP